MAKANATRPENKAHVVQVQASRCAKCGSTEREPYYASTVQQFSGVDAAGDPFTHIVRRRTRCRNCLQVRIDRSYENRLPGQDLEDVE